MKSWKFLCAICAFFMIGTAGPAFADTMYLCTNPYTLFQLGNNGTVGGDKLEITSNSSVFGSTLKGVDNKPEKNKISTSKVTGSWDKETGVVNDFSSSWTGSQNTLTQTAFDAFAATALAVSNYWAAQDGTNIPIYLNSNQTLTINVSGGTAGANVYDITGEGVFINSDSKLILDGDPGDFFVFNISAQQYFKLQSNSIIELAGDIEASEVLWNIQGNIGTGTDTALIGGGSIFQGTLLAPGKNVEITQNHFYTFNSEGYNGTQAPETTAITAAMAIAEKELNDSSWGGLWGQIIAGGFINFTESDIADDRFCPKTVNTPEPASMLLMGAGLMTWGVIHRRKRRQKRAFTGTGIFIISPGFRLRTKGSHGEE